VDHPFVVWCAGPAMSGPPCRPSCHAVREMSGGSTRPPARTLRGRGVVGAAVHNGAMAAPRRDLPSSFSPATTAWFTESFDAPTAAQVGAWEAIERGDDTLVVAPTGSGKT